MLCVHSNTLVAKCGKYYIAYRGYERHVERGSFEVTELGWFAVAAIAGLMFFGQVNNIFCKLVDSQEQPYDRSKSEKKNVVQVQENMI